MFEGVDGEHEYIFIEDVYFSGPSFDVFIVFFYFFLYLFDEKILVFFVDDFVFDVLCDEFL